MIDTVEYRGRSSGREQIDPLSCATLTTNFRSPITEETLSLLGFRRLLRNPWTPETVHEFILGLRSQWQARAESLLEQRGLSNFPHLISNPFGPEQHHRYCSLLFTLRTGQGDCKSGALAAIAFLANKGLKAYLLGLSSPGMFPGTKIGHEVCAFRQNNKWGAVGVQEVDLVPPIHASPGELATELNRRYLESGLYDQPREIYELRIVSRLLAACAPFNLKPFCFEVQRSPILS